MNYLIGELPEHILVFGYGNRLTKQRRMRCASILLEFVKEEYDLQPSHLTFKRAHETLNKQFHRSTMFERTDNGYRTDNQTSCNNPKPITIYDL